MMKLSISKAALLGGIAVALLNFILPGGDEKLALKSLLAFICVAALAALLIGVNCTLREYDLRLKHRERPAIAYAILSPIVFFGVLVAGKFLFY